MTVIYTTEQGDTLDYICWEYYGATTGRVVEQVLEANKDLAQKGAVYPLGVKIILPEITENQTTISPVRLWD